MIMTNRILPVALVAALIGGSVGAFVMHSRNEADNSGATLTAQGGAEGIQSGNSELTNSELTNSAPQVAYRNVGSSSVRNVSTARRVASDYQRPRSRSFWQKHRDKLTVAMGTGGGAVLGGLIGGKKGAAIGALSGAGGSALYTYKIRKRNRRY